MAGFSTRLLAGLAVHLDLYGVGTWRESGAYADTETAIVIRAIPPGPDRLLSLAAYPVGSASPGLADHRLGVQVRVRGTTDPRVCDDLADAVYDLLDGASRLDFGGVPVVQAWRQSYTSLGQDAGGRWERSENFYLDTMRPTAHNTD